MDESTARFWTVIFGGITAVSLIAGGLYTLVQYERTKELEQRNKEAEQRNFELQLSNAQLEAKRPFFSKQLEFCNEVTETAAKLSVLSKKRDQKEWNSAWKKYWILFFGPTRMLAGPSVFEATIKFGECLDNYCDGEPIMSRSLEIADACRAELSENWNVNLPHLEKTPQPNLRK
jgi:hypothetical protein